MEMTEQQVKELQDDLKKAIEANKNLENSKVNTTNAAIEGADE